MLKSQDAHHPLASSLVLVATPAVASTASATVPSDRNVKAPLQLTCSGVMTLAYLRRLKRILDFGQNVAWQLGQDNITTKQVREVRSKIKFVRQVLACDDNTPTL